MQPLYHTIPHMASRKRTRTNKDQQIMQSSEKTMTCLAIVPFTKRPTTTTILRREGGATTHDDGDDKNMESALPMTLPDSLLPDILSYCDAVTLCQVVALVNTTWYYASKADALWEGLCRQQFGLSATQIKPRPRPVKKLYQKAHVSLQAILRQSSSSSTSYFGGGGGNTLLGQSLSRQGYLTIRVSSSSS